MDKNIRVAKIAELKPYGKTEIRWEDKLETMDIYKIPLQYLVYNKYNGRILSRTKSLEKQGQVIDVESEDGAKKISQLLWDSKLDRNKKTLKSLDTYGQEKVGIVTKDGIIIDGNRRAMLLNKIDKYDYFKAVVLPVELDENPLEIEKLETSHQMGEDKKLDYNPIEKYIKVKELMNKLLVQYNEVDAKKKIEEWMNEPLSKIENYIDVMETMDDYLDNLEYDGIYTQLDGREDHLISLTKWKKSFLNLKETPPSATGSKKAFDNYASDDVDDLINIAYDYIRVRHEGKDFRKISEGKKENHLFGSQEVWKSFKEKHFNQSDKAVEQEEEINFDFQNIEAHLNDRDQKYKENIGKYLKQNLNDHYQLIRNKQYQDEPEKLVKNAKRAIEAISPNSDSLSSDVVQNEVKDLNRIINELLLKSPLKTLEYINELLTNVTLDNIEDEERLREEVFKINKTSFDLKKQLGR